MKWKMPPKISLFWKSREKNRTRWKINLFNQAKFRTENWLWLCNWKICYLFYRIYESNNLLAELRELCKSSIYVSVLLIIRMQGLWIEFDKLMSIKLTSNFNFAKKYLSTELILIAIPSSFNLMFLLKLKDF